MEPQAFAMLNANIERIRRQLDSLMEQQAAHAQQHAADRMRTEDHRVAIVERVKGLESTIQTRTLWGGAMMTLATVLSPILIHLQVKLP